MEDPSDALISSSAKGSSVKAAKSHKSIKKTKSSTATLGEIGDAPSVEDHVDPDGDDGVMSPVSLSTMAVSGSGDTPSPLLKKKKSSTVKKGSSTKKSKKVVPGGPDDGEASPTTAGLDEDDDDDAREDSGGAQAAAASGAEGWEARLEALEDIPLTASVMVPNTPTAAVSPNMPATPHLSFSSPSSGAPGLRSPRQVSFVNAIDQSSEGAPASTSRVSALWEPPISADNDDRDYLPASPHGEAAAPTAPPSLNGSATGDTRMPPFARADGVGNTTDASAMSGASWQSLQQSFSSMFVGTQSGGGDVDDMRNDAQHSGTTTSSAHIPAGMLDVSSHHHEGRRRSGADALSGDWAAIMEPVERPMGRLEQPDQSRHHATSVHKLRRVPHATLDGNDGEQELHDDEASSPSRVARVLPAAVRSHHGPPDLQAETNLAAAAYSSSAISAWVPLSVAGGHVTTEARPDPMLPRRASTSPPLLSRQPLTNEPFVRERAPEAARNVSNSQQQIHPLPSTPASSRAQSTAATIMRPEQQQPGTAFGSPSAQSLLHSLGDDDDAAFFRGDDYHQAYSRPITGGAGQRLSRTKGGDASSPAPTTSHRATGGSTRTAAAPRVWADGSGGGGAGGSGGSATHVPAATAPRKSVTTPNRQIASGPRYIQTSARYPSNFAPHRTRSPEPQPTASTSRTPTPSTALTRHSRSPRTSPQPSRSPSIPLPTQASYYMSSAPHHSSQLHHDNVPLYHRSPAYEPLAVIDAQHVRVTPSKNGGKSALHSTSVHEQPAGAHSQPSVAKEVGDARVISGSAFSAPQPIIIYTSPPPMAGQLGWWGAPLQGGIPPHAHPHLATHTHTPSALSSTFEAPPPPSFVVDGHEASSPPPVAAASPYPQQMKSGTLPHQHNPGNPVASQLRASAVSSPTPKQIRQHAAMRVMHRYQDVYPSYTLDKRPLVPSTLLAYLKPAELQQLEQLQQAWHSASVRADHLRIGLHAQQNMTATTRASLETMRGRHEALLASQSRTHDVMWQHHLATLH